MTHCNTTYVPTYSDIVQCNSAFADVQAQPAADSGAPALCTATYKYDTQVPTTTSTPRSLERPATDLICTYRNKLDVHGNDICTSKLTLGVGGSVGEGVGKGIHDRYVVDPGKSKGLSACSSAWIMCSL